MLKETILFCKKINKFIDTGLDVFMTLGCGWSLGNYKEMYLKKHISGLAEM